MLKTGVNVSTEGGMLASGCVVLGTEDKWWGKLESGMIMTLTDWVPTMCQEPMHHL